MTSDHRLLAMRGLARATLRRAAAACAALMMLVAVTAGCVATTPREEVREYLDKQTAATVTVLGRPIVFAMERPELAVHARDYLTLVPIDVNRSGAHKRYYYGYAWSTIDKRGLGEYEAPPVRYDLVADGRRISLVPLAVPPRELGLGEEPLPPPNARASRVIAATTADLQEFATTAQEIVAVAVREGGGDRFALWAR
jgi:hypothetical protein